MAREQPRVVLAVPLTALGGRYTARGRIGPISRPGIVTRSVSEETLSQPRLRFGLLSRIGREQYGENLQNWAELPCEKVPGPLNTPLALMGTVHRMTHHLRAAVGDADDHHADHHGEDHGGDAP